MGLECRNIPAVFTVTTTADAGSGSLRQAILDANAISGADSVDFDNAVFATPQSIGVLGGEMTITDAVSINGPGATLLTLLGSPVASDINRFFSIANAGTVAISGMTLSHGLTTSSGGAIRATSNVDLHLANVTFDTNKVTDFSTYAGAVYLVNSNVSCTLLDSTFVGNEAESGGAIGTSGVSADIQRCTFSANVCRSGDGGAINGYSFGTGSLTISNSTFHGNISIGGNGGAIMSYGSPTFITNSTFVANSCARGGGALTSDSMAVRNSTITGNSAGQSGGAFASSLPSTLTLSSTIMAGNLATLGAQELFFGSTTNIAGDNNLIGVSDQGNFALTGTGNKTGTAASPLDAKLGPIANNGGPTMTCALLAGSPAINQGNNALSLTYDQRGTGFPRVYNGQADIGAFESAPAPPTVTTVQLNNGSVQRSRVTMLTVTFSETVTFPDGIAAAFRLDRTGPGGPTGAVNVNVSQVGSIVTVTFATGGTVGVDPGGSLIDGRYTLTLVASKIQGMLGFLDGNGDGTAGDDYVQVGGPASPSKLFRLFGDADGNGAVDAADFAALRSVFGVATNLAFDFDGDGDVDALDFGAFRQRFGTGV